VRNDNDAFKSRRQACPPCPVCPSKGNQ
jgi:hypothetical protein